MKMSLTLPLQQRQKGVVLIVALIMLVVMTAVGVTVMTGSSLQERMAGNNRQRSIARLNAEAALRFAEQQLDALNINASTDPIAAINEKFTDTTARGHWVAIYSSKFAYDPVAFDLSDPAAWSEAAASAKADGPASGTTTTPSHYVVEYIGEMPLNKPQADIDISVEKKNTFEHFSHTFRITAIGYGRDPKINAILRSIYSTANN
ncbi:MAG: type IV pilus assembly protein PilX [Cellvibrionaceae bacterium]|jgi:type IV pilus assembly protein PilX